MLGEPAFADALETELARDLGAGAPPGRTARDRVARAGAVGAAGLDDARGAGGGADDLRGIADGLAVPVSRAIHDARGGGIAGLLGDLVAAGAPVLAIAAHAGQRARALGGRVGGFAVTSWAALEADPGLAAGFTHVVAVDPPAHAQLEALAAHLPGDGWTHLAWGEPELDVARRVLAWELDLRAPLIELFRGLLRHATEPSRAGTRTTTAPACRARRRRPRRAAARRRSQPRSGALAGRLLRVLAELGLSS